MLIPPSLKLAWHALWTLKKQRLEARWIRPALATALAFIVWLALLALGSSGSLVLEPLDAPIWNMILFGSLVICLCIAHTILALACALERALPARLLERLSPARDWRAVLALNALVICGAMLGNVLGLALGGALFGVDVWSEMFISAPQAMLHFLNLLLVIAAINGVIWFQRIRAQALRHQATEAQLRLLQGQIEPHFLFNTLANVQSLMDYDPPRAKQMLEGFTDYLRASLGQLRDADSTLALELQTIETYLSLLQIRMGERLRFSIEASEQARAAVLPTLLLQPLVENAIHHGLEPKVAGGSVYVRASVEAGRLVLCVEDDGLGLDAPRRTVGAGNGMALANLRARLQSRYGPHAALTLTPLGVGTRAQLELPLRSMP
ncbi:MAG: histidine kinase [Pseudomonadota bacterium]